MVFYEYASTHERFHHFIADILTLCGEGDDD